LWASPWSEFRRIAIRPIEFAKLSGSGNDFICIDNRDGRFDEIISSPERVGHVARALCSRRMGVGGDGLIFGLACAQDDEADISARFFEPDGSEAELCGNGTACFAFWVLENAWVPGKELRILTRSGVVHGRKGHGDYVHVCIPLPQELQTDVAFTLDGKPWTCDFAVTGVPHAVVYVDDVDKVDVARLGAAIRHHERFGPRGVNVNFTQVLAQGEIAVRTFEFGVEAETLACGTGSATAAIMTALRLGWPSEYLSQGKPIRVRARSGDILKIHLLREEDGTFTKVCLETVVRFIYSARLHPDLAAGALGGGRVRG